MNSNAQQRESSTTFTLALATLMSLCVAIGGSFGGYYLGYKQAKLEMGGAAEKGVEVAKAAPTAPDAKPQDKKSPTKAELVPSSFGVGDFPELGSLSGQQKETAIQVLNTTIGACEPCTAKGLSLGTCIKEQAICENMPRLLNRVVRGAASGKALADLQADLSYDEPWVKVDITGSPVKGSASAPVTIIEYSDYQCPFCARVQTTVKQLEEKYGDKIKVAFLNAPLSRHDKAEPAARASLAANKQGKFWKYHDLLFERQKDFRTETFFDDLAKEAGLNMSKYKADMEDASIKDLVKRDMMQSGKVGVRGTPTFFVNGYRVRGAKPAAYFERIIDLELGDLGK